MSLGNKVNLEMEVHMNIIEVDLLLTAIIERYIQGEEVDSNFRVGETNQDHRMN